MVLSCFVWLCLNFDNAMDPEESHNGFRTLLNFLRIAKSVVKSEPSSDSFNIASHQESKVTSASVRFDNPPDQTEMEGSQRSVETYISFKSFTDPRGSQEFSSVSLSTSDPHGSQEFTSVSLSSVDPQGSQEFSSVSLSTTDPQESPQPLHGSQGVVKADDEAVHSGPSRFFSLDKVHETFRDSLKLIKPDESPRIFSRSLKTIKSREPYMDHQTQTNWTYSERVCPSRCCCKYRPDGTICIVDCSYKGLSKIPQLPATASEVYLQYNSFQEVPCNDFSSLKMLRKLNLSRNRIGVLFNCSFSDLTSLQYLWLSQNQLFDVPIRVFESLHELVELDLSQNKIRIIDSQPFTQMGTLKSLNLDTNRLTKIKNDTFQGLKSLESLSLQGNSLRYLPGTFETGAFQGLTSLVSLHLEGNQPDLPDNFTYPDQALAQVPTLQRIWLDGYPRPLGPGFASLVHLTHLSFAGADGGACAMYSDIPPHFFFHLATQHPISINMSYCFISMIPADVFKHVPTIRSLDLTWNNRLLMDGFEKASQGLRDSNITVLNITHIVSPFPLYSIIKNTTFQYLRATRLKVLIVDHCFLTNVDSRAIKDLPETLEYISFCFNNFVQELKILTFIRFRNLKVFSISNQLRLTQNDLFPFDRDASSHEKLRNRIKKPSETQDGYVQRLPPSDSPINHKGVTVSSNTDTRTGSRTDFAREDTLVSPTSACSRDIINTVPMPYPLTRNLLEVHASDIKASTIIPRIQFVNNKVLKYFDFTLNGIKCFGGPVYGLPSIQHADLSRNWCFQLNPQFFSHVPSLKTLLLYKNMLGRALADDAQGITFSNLTNLEILDLSNNVIEDLSEQAFVKNRNLKLLNLSKNEISSFHPSLANNKRLEILDLSSNLLVGLSESTCKHLHAIKESNANFTVRIGGNNKFLCSCDYLHFLNFILGHADIFEDVNTFHCLHTSGAVISYSKLARVLPQLALQCLSQSIFIGVLVVFFILVGSLTICAIYHFKRWQWKYLYYLSRSRLHIGSMRLTQRPDADVFITYDQVRD